MTEQRARLEDLWTLWRSGAQLFAEEEDAVLAALTEDGPLRDELLDDGELEGQLAVLTARRAGQWSDDERFARSLLQRLDAQRDMARFVSQVDARIAAGAAGRRRKRGWSLALGLVAAAALVVFVSRISREGGTGAPPAGDRVVSHADEDAAGLNELAAAAPPLRAEDIGRFTEVTGAVYLVDAGRKVVAANGAAVAASQAISTVGANSSARVTLADGTDLDISGDSFVWAGRDGGGAGRVFVATGTLRARVAAVAPLVFVTPHAESAATAARLTLMVATSSTRISVSEGQAVLRRGSGARAVVHAGQQAVVVDDSSRVTAGPIPEGGLAFLLTSTVNLGPGDALLKQRLTGLGFEVRIRWVNAPATEFENASLVVISSTAEANHAGPQLRNLRIPILCAEAGLFDDLGMTGADDREGDSGLDREATGELTITNDSHPLAAGLTGSVRVTAAPRIELHWGRPGPIAAWVASVPGTPPRAGIFAYERGIAMLGGLAAPARRVGFFLSDDGPPLLNETGWSLFDAAVRWCAEGGEAKR